MIEKISKELCCGCGACSNACPYNCIEMHSDEEGFLYPKIDKKKCVNCHACERVCPFIDYKEPVCEIRRGYAGRISEHNILPYVASGGIYTAIASYIVDNGGVAIGVELVEGVVQHTVIDKKELLIHHSSSKYVQSYTGEIYKRVKDFLKDGKTVLFSGTPCQIVALHKYVGGENKNLFTVDVLCAGVCSPKIFEDYIANKRKGYSGEIEYINFKRKTYGYHSSTMYVRFSNGKYSNRSRLTDEMMHVYTAHIGDRPSCSSCPIKGIDRCSDFTIFDCWHYGQLTGRKDDNKGYTNIIIHSLKGQKLLEACKTYLETIEIDVKRAVELDGNMFYGILNAHKNRSSFFFDLKSNGLRTAIENNCPILLRDKIKEASKGMLYKLGMLERVKKLKR